MKPVLILYATREGHTLRIVESIEATIRQRGLLAVSRNAAATHGEIDFAAFGAVLLAAPVHAGKHPREMVKLVKACAPGLSRVPTAMITVCLAQAGIENPKTSPEKRAEAQRAVQLIIDEFIGQTGFHPTRVKVVAGALPYTKYNFFIRWIMKRIVAKEGGDTDTTRDYVYTNWAALDRFVHQFLVDNRLVAIQPLQADIVSTPLAS